MKYAHIYKHGKKEQRKYIFKIVYLPNCHKYILCMPIKSIKRMSNDEIKKILRLYNSIFPT